MDGPGVIILYYTDLRAEREFWRAMRVNLLKDIYGVGPGRADSDLPDDIFNILVRRLHNSQNRQ